VEDGLVAARCIGTIFWIQVGRRFKNGLVEPAGVVTFVFEIVQPGAENSRPGCETFIATDFESVFRANEDKVRESR
jgi:hypothetical protein